MKWTNSCKHTHSHIFLLNIFRASDNCVVGTNISWYQKLCVKHYWNIISFTYEGKSLSSMTWMAVDDSRQYHHIISKTFSTKFSVFGNSISLIISCHCFICFIYYSMRFVRTFGNVTSFIETFLYFDFNDIFFLMKWKFKYHQNLQSCPLCNGCFELLTGMPYESVL